MAKLSLSQLAQQKENLRLLASEQRMVLAQNIRNLEPIRRWSRVGFMTFGMVKGMAGIFALVNLFRGKSSLKSSSKVKQFLVGLGLARKLLSFFRRRP